MQKSESFNNLVEAFKKLDIEDKMTMVIDELKRTEALTLAMNDSIGESRENDILLSREVLDVLDSNVSNEDFVEAVFVYIYSIREEVAHIYNTLYDKLENK